MFNNKINNCYYGLILASVFLFISPKETAANTNVSGIISSDTIWQLSDSPIIITGNVLVNSGVTLIIEPGVTIKFNSSYIIQINGKLAARGLKNSEIIFTSNKSIKNAGDWGYVFFTDSSTDATFDTSGNYLDGSIMEYCNLSYGGSGNKGSVYSKISAPFINNCIIEKSASYGIFFEENYSYTTTHIIKVINNTIRNNNLCGLYFYYWGFYKISVMGNDINNNGSGGVKFIDFGAQTVNFENNLINNNFSGGGIYIGSSYGASSIAGGWAQFNISKNIISYNNNTGYEGYGGGIFAAGHYLTINDNIIKNNKADRGGGICIGDASSRYTHNILNNIIANNFAQKAGAMRLDKYITYPWDISITNNSILYNTTGANEFIVELYSYSSIYNGVGNYLFANNNIFGNKGYASLLYAPFLNGSEYDHKFIIHNNNLAMNNTIYELYNSSSAGISNIDAKNNYWGTIFGSEIQNKIYDWFDNGSKAIVDYSPFLISSDTTAPIFPPSDLIAQFDNNNINIHWNANSESDAAGYRVYWDTDGFPYDNVVDIGDSTNYTITGFNTGNCFIGITAYDNDYNSTNDDINTIVNENQTSGNESWYTETKQNSSLQVSLIANPTSGSIPLLVNFTANAYDSNGIIVKYEWDLDGSGSYETVTIGNTCSYIYNTAGTYNAKVQVTNNKSVTTISIKTIKVNIPPTVTLVASETTGVSTLTVDFTANAYDLNGTIEKYEWDLDGNGSYETNTTENTRTFTYNESGTYNAKVRVTDNDNATAIDTKTIIVNRLGNIDTSSPGSANRIDGQDVYLFSLSFGYKLGDPYWNSVCDFNGDLIIDGNDLVLLSANFGKKN